MTVKYGKFEMPEKIKVETENETNCKFIIEPFERGYGHTIGNALRRVMLSSIEAPAIISIRIEGVPHEYTAVEGIIEDMTHIILNLKSALLRLPPLEGEAPVRESKVVTKILEISEETLQSNGGQYKVRLKDLLGMCDYEIVNPELHIFTVTRPFSKRVDVRVGTGRGYVPSERHEGFERVVDEIVVDSIFSPVRVVNYLVENTRVGQDTDFDRLILDVTTDGRISPKEALTFAAQIGISHFAVFEQLQTHAITFDQGEVESNKDKEEILSKLCLRINEIELSVRSTNCLASANIDTIGELVVMPESEMLRFRNFGKKSLTEIKQKLEEMGLHLGMDLNRYGINRDNIRDIITKYNEEKNSNGEA